MPLNTSLVAIVATSGNSLSLEAIPGLTAVQMAGMGGDRIKKD